MFFKKAKKLTAFLAVFLLCLSMAVPVCATGNANVADPTEGILDIRLAYVYDDGSYDWLQGGTCFLINEEYVLTNYHVVTLDSGTAAQFEEDTGIHIEGVNDKHLQLYLMVNHDMMIEATVDSNVYSSELDFALVKLERDIFDRTPLVLGDSSQVRQRDAVYALGFPEDSITTDESHTAADVSAVSGNISKVTEMAGYDIFEHTASLNSGNSGGPLVDANDVVIGINTFVGEGGVDGGYKNYATQINEIRKGLDTFGISYSTAGSQPAPSTEPVEPTPGTDPVEPTPETTPSVDFAALENAIKAAEQIVAGEYTEESYENLQAALTEAKRVYTNTNAIQSDVDGAVRSLNEAQDALEVASGINMLLVAIIAAIVAIIIIIIVVLATGKKKKAPVQTMIPPQPMPGVPTGSMPTVPGGTGGMAPPKTGFTPQSVSGGESETTVLNAGSGETTLLGGGGVSRAYLVRKKNGEKITVSSAHFLIGKERSKVSYCIADNTSVSRTHALITKKGSGYFISDQGSTNFTFVNGNKLVPHQDTALEDKAIIKISDEEFEFHLG